VKPAVGQPMDFDMSQVYLSQAEAESIWNRINYSSDDSNAQDDSYSDPEVLCHHPNSSDADEEMEG